MPGTTSLACVGENVSFGVLVDVVLQLKVEVSQKTVPAETESAASHNFFLELVRELEHFVNGGFRRDFVNGTVQKFDGLLGNRLELGTSCAPKPIKVVAQESIPIKVVRLSHQSPSLFTETSEEHP